jgi:hypothetical protein
LIHNKEDKIKENRTSHPSRYYTQQRGVPVSIRTGHQRTRKKIFHLWNCLQYLFVYALVDILEAAEYVRDCFNHTEQAVYHDAMMDSEMEMAHVVGQRVPCF